MDEVDDLAFIVELLVEFESLLLLIVFELIVCHWDEERADLTSEVRLMHGFRFGGLTAVGLDTIQNVHDAVLFVAPLGHELQSVEGVLNTS